VHAHAALPVVCAAHGRQRKHALTLSESKQSMLHHTACMTSSTQRSIVSPLRVRWRGPDGSPAPVHARGPQRIPDAPAHAAQAPTPPVGTAEARGVSAPCGRRRAVPWRGPCSLPRRRCASPLHRLHVRAHPLAVYPPSQPAGRASRRAALTCRPSSEARGGK